MQLSKPDGKCCANVDMHRHVACCEPIKTSDTRDGLRGSEHHLLSRGNQPNKGAFNKYRIPPNTLSDWDVDSFFLKISLVGLSLLRKEPPILRTVSNKSLY